MCEEEQPTVSVIAPLQAKLLKHFTVTAEDSSVITEMKQIMAKDLEHRYMDVRQVLYRASALDPRYKNLPFLSEEERDATFQFLIHEASELMIQKVRIYFLVSAIFYKFYIFYKFIKMHNLFIWYVCVCVIIYRMTQCHRLKMQRLTHLLTKLMMMMMATLK